MKNAQHDAERWLRQAENDLAFAQTGLENGFYAQTCFLAQQVGEKAVKAAHKRATKTVFEKIKCFLCNYFAFFLPGPLDSRFGELSGMSSASESGV